MSLRSMAIAYPYCDPFDGRLHSSIYTLAKPNASYALIGSSLQRTGPEMSSRRDPPQAHLRLQRAVPRDRACRSLSARTSDNAVLHAFPFTGAFAQFLAP